MGDPYSGSSAQHVHVTRLPRPPLAIIYNPVFDTLSPHLTLLVCSHIMCYYHSSLTQQHTNKENILFFRTSHPTTHTNTRHILSFRTSHPTKHTNTKYIVLQNISPNQTHKHKTSFLRTSHPTKHNPAYPSDPTTGRQHINIPHIIHIRNILCY